jgi:hypothetical protein
LSQLYRVTVRSSVSEVLRATDEVCYPLEWAALVDTEATAEILREALLGRGYRPDPENGRRLIGTGPAGEEVVFDLDAMQVTARLEDTRELQATAEASGEAEDSQRQAEAEARRNLSVQEARARQRLSERGAELQEDLTRRLVESEDARRRHLHEIVQQVYAESLKQKARQMGDVVELREGTGADGQYELTITVEIG